MGRKQNAITSHEIEEAQRAWGDSVIKIGAAFLDGENFEELGRKHVDQFYAYDISTVLFKPTRASENQFRQTKEEAVSYFVGSNTEYSEDLGFALAPWKSIRFENNDFILGDSIAICMGNYYFTDYKGNEAKVEYTLGFIKDKSGELKINLHHSSIPFSQATQDQVNFLKEYSDLVL